MLVRPILLML